MTTMDHASDLSGDAYRAYIAHLRDRLDFTQEKMAGALGMSLRAYSDIENGVSKCRKVHVWAAERLSIREARERGDAALMAESVKQDLSLMGGLGEALQAPRRFK